MDTAIHMDLVLAEGWLVPANEDELLPCVVKVNQRVEASCLQTRVVDLELKAVGCVAGIEGGFGSASGFEGSVA